MTPEEMQALIDQNLNKVRTVRLKMISDVLEASESMGAEQQLEYLKKLANLDRYDAALYLSRKRSLKDISRG